MQLLIERAVLIGFVHTAPQRPFADVPDIRETVIGGLGLGAYLQRIARFCVVKTAEDNRLVACFYAQLNEAERAQPKRLVHFFCFRSSIPGRVIMVGKSMQMAVDPVSPLPLQRQVAVPIVLHVTLRLEQVDFGPFSALHSQVQVSGHFLSSADLNNFRCMRRDRQGLPALEQLLPILDLDSRLPDSGNSVKTSLCAVKERDGSGLEVPGADGLAHVGVLRGGGPLGIIIACVHPAVERLIPPVVLINL